MCACVCVCRAPLPTKITVLKSVIRPSGCGDTIFVDTHAAYESLSADTKIMLEGAKGNYCYLKLRDVGSSGTSENLNQHEVKSARSCAVHPLVTTHPITGRQNLYANPSHTSSVVGQEDSSTATALLQHLFEHTAAPEYRYRHVYDDDDVIIWDNRGSCPCFSAKCTMPGLVVLRSICLLMFFLCVCSCSSQGYWVPC